MNNKISVVVPAYKRVDQTLDTIRLLFESKGIAESELEVIVSDSTPENELGLALRKEFNGKVIYTRPQLPGIASNKNQGARLAQGRVIVFCDSDMEVEKDTLLNTINTLKTHEEAAAVGGRVF